VLLDTSFTGKGPTLDADGDGMSDPWEIANFGDLDEDGTGDADSDGLTDAQEFAAGSNPNSTDSDGDGLLDAAEVAAGSWFAIARREGQLRGDGNWSAILGLLGNLMEDPISTRRWARQQPADLIGPDATSRGPRISD
jgi:hypothetical protein